MVTTSQIREWWEPACAGPYESVGLYGRGFVNVRPEVVPATRALSGVLRKHSYPTRYEDTGGFNCRKITGGTDWSLHAYGIAIDINWSTNPYGPTLITDMPTAMVRDIKALRTNSGAQVWRWGGDYTGNKDAMHMEVIASPSALRTGIVTPTVTRPPSPEEDVLIITCSGKPTRFLTGFTCAAVSAATVTSLKAQGVRTAVFTAADYDALLKHVSDSLGR